ncbi:septation protein SepH [Luteimicrobium sp. DT211]|uniref:septation protein SepH n=1 Tax=Luteimicrobium sp. DT211 TaxID=3393412 RepID=UPI003CEC9591
MNELNLVGLHEDGESLVLAGPMGERYTVRIDDALRAAVRRDRPQLEQLRASSTATLPVREIQARIRAGATAEEVATEAGVPVEHVRRYEGPVLAEREHVVDRVRATRLGDADAPTLTDLVADRLASRDVDADDVAWDAARDTSGSWRATARFVAGGAERTATWAYDASSREVRALDDEARWLSENEVGVPRTGVSEDDVRSAVRPVLSAVDGLLERGHDPRRPRDAAATDALLDDLGRRRGSRSDALPDLDDDFEGFGPLRDDPHPAGSRGDRGRDDRQQDDRGRRSDEPADADGHDEHAPDEREPDGHGSAGGLDERRGRRGKRQRQGHDRVPVTDRLSVADVVALPFPARDAHPGEGEGVPPDAGTDAAPSDAAPERDAESDHGPGDGAPEQSSDLEPAGAGRPEGRRPASSSRKQRAKMPSWDEIMFGGSRTDA